MTRTHAAGNRNRHLDPSTAAAILHGIGYDYATCRPKSYAFLRPAGPQPHNLIAPTAEAQLARASRPPLTARQRHRRRLARVVRRLMHRLLAAELPAAVEYLLVTELAKRNGQSTRRVRP
jgi:hypothetical protein